MFFRLSKKSEFTEQDNVCYDKNMYRDAHIFTDDVYQIKIYTRICVFTDDRFLIIYHKFMEF